MGPAPLSSGSPVSAEPDGGLPLQPNKRVKLAAPGL